MALADIVLWKVRMITNKDTWPSRQHYPFLQLFPDPVERVEAKGMVHGYLGRMASREMEQFLTEAELRRLDTNMMEYGLRLPEVRSKPTYRTSSLKCLTIYIRTPRWRGQS